MAMFSIYGKNLNHFVKFQCVGSPAPIIEPGQEGNGLVTAAETAKLYVQAVEGDFTGRVLQRT